MNQSQESDLRKGFESSMFETLQKSVFGEAFARSRAYVFDRDPEKGGLYFNPSVEAAWQSWKKAYQVYQVVELEKVVLETTKILSDHLTDSTGSSVAVGDLRSMSRDVVMLHDVLKSAVAAYIGSSREMAAQALAGNSAEESMNATLDVLFAIESLVPGILDDPAGIAEKYVLKLTQWTEKGEPK